MCWHLRSHQASQLPHFPAAPSHLRFYPLQSVEASLDAITRSSPVHATPNATASLIWACPTACTHSAAHSTACTPLYRRLVFCNTDVCPPACNVLYINSVDMESLTGPQAIAKAITQTLATNPLPAATMVHFKVSAQGITLTDSQRKWVNIPSLTHICFILHI